MPYGDEQFDTSKQPTVQLLGGRKVYRFDDSNDVIRVSATLSTRPFTIVVMYASKSTAAGKRVLSSGVGGGNWLLGPRSESGGVGTTYSFFNGAFVPGTAVDVDVLHTHSVRQQASGTIAQYRIDGVSQGTNTSANIPGELTLGSATFAAETANADVIGICIYNVWLSDADLAAVETYWATGGGGTTTPGTIQATQSTLEVLGQNPAPFARVTQSTLEVIAAVPPPQMRVSQAVLEVLVRYGGRAWSQIIY